MTTANIHDRDSVARAYPPETFAADASENDRPRIEILKGVRIVAAPDEAGEFALERAALYAGETPGAVFLAPFHRRTAEENAPIDPDPHHGYEAFLDEIIEAARQRGFDPKKAPGPGDPRLRGLRQ